MSISLEYSPSNRATCKRCHDKIGKGDLRMLEYVDASEYAQTQYRHWGCATPQQVEQLGVNMHWFHGLSADDQKRVVAAIKEGRVPDADVSELLKPNSHAIPIDLTMSPNAKYTETKPWPPSKPATKGKGKSMFVERASSKRKLQEASSSSSNSREAGVFDAAPGPSSSSAAMPSSSQTKPPTSSAPRQPGEVANGRLVQEQDQEEEEEEEEEAAVQEDDVFYLRYPTEVVGIQHYHGLVGVGEAVNLIRQPANQYDSNAIQVTNLNNQQVGHIGRGVAARLAPLMDRRVIDVHGVMRTGNLDGTGGRWKLQVFVDIYGPPSSRLALGPHLSFFGEVSETGIPPYENATQVDGTSRSPSKGGNKKGKRRMLDDDEETEQEKEARLVIENLKNLDKGEGRNDKVMEELMKGFDVLKMPLHPNPPSKKSGEFRNDLLPHQSQGLLWMQSRENPVLPQVDGEQVQLWQRKGGAVPHWLNIATKTPQAITSPPVLGRGGIMADAMGLGKTLTVLSLIIAGKKEKSDGYCKSTLIVCPLSVLSNWENQIDEHVREGVLSYMVYHGDGKSVSQDQLEQTDVIITTYNVLSAELKANGGNAKKKKGKGKASNLLGTKWTRVVLDEGHTARNLSAAMTRACISLDTQRRWVVSGTPIVNGAKDLGALLSFLRVCKPLDEADQFKRLIIRRLDGGPGVGLLQAIMSHSCLRRTKEMEDDNGKRLVPLPPVNFYVVKVDLYEEDRGAYDLAMAASKRRFEEYVNNERTGSLPPNVLQLLTRLRQLALVSTLVPPNYIEDISKDEAKHSEIDKITEEAKNALIWKLKAAIDDSEECPICFDSLTNPRITMCGHPYCLECILEVIKVQAKCPMDRTPLPSTKYVLELPEVLPKKAGEESDTDVEEIKADMENAEDILKPASSAKIDELLKYLKAFPEGQKTLVFSQFTKFLDAIAPHLRAAGIPFVRFDGSMSAKKRAEIIDQFQQPIELDEGGSETEESEEEEDLHSSRKKGKGKAKPKIRSKKSAAENPAVMLISLKSGSVGINLTAAQNVFLMDPWWQNAVEAQAIDRVNRIGQKASEVRVFQIVAKDTIEDKVLEIQARKEDLIQQAFSGTKRKETAREKKEARFNEMRALFGVGTNNSAGPSRLVQSTL